MGIFFRSVLLCSLFVGAGALSAQPQGASPPTREGSSQFAAAEARARSVEQELSVVADKKQGRLSFSDAVRKAAPSVVNIFSRRKIRERLSPFSNDPFFERFFGEDFSFFDIPRERVQSSLGSGVIVDATGLVITNYHVIEGAQEIEIVLHNQEQFEAQVGLADPKTDLAVLQIKHDGRSFAPITLAGAHSLEVGDIVLALGNPFGVGQTVTMGIVSALARTGVSDSGLDFFIQTDAAINPGNSGGAMVDVEGRLVGVNTAIFTRSGGSLGIGFAIPVSMVERVLSSARTGDRMQRAWLGLHGQTLDGELAQSFGLGTANGVAVSEVYAHGPAERAGLQAGDIIVALDERPLRDWQDLRFRVASMPPEGAAEMTFWRNWRKLRTTFPLEKAPETPPRETTPLEGEHPLSGALVAGLSPALGEERNIDGLWSGVIILKTVGSSPAGRIGFRSNDVILSVNGKNVRRPGELKQQMENAGRFWKIILWRGGKTRTFAFST